MKHASHADCLCQVSVYRASRELYRTSVVVIMDNPFDMKTFTGSAVPRSDQVKTEQPIIPSIEIDDTFTDSGCSTDSEVKDGADGGAQPNAQPVSSPCLRRVDTLENVIWRKCCRHVLAAHIGTHSAEPRTCSRTIWCPSDMDLSSPSTQNACRYQHGRFADHG